MKANGERTVEIVRRLKQAYPATSTALRHRGPFELLVATILSAQTTDAAVNAVTPELFRRYPTPQALARADPGELEQIIYPTGFYRQKARHLIATGQRLVSDYRGQVPETLEELVRLPGVARKTANVVTSVCFPHNQSGIAVDTHVKRLARRLGLTRQADPGKVERDLMEVVPPEDWGTLTHLLIAHGRRVCTARRPNCAGCLLSELCPSAFQF